jgi:RNA polymerase sigma factor (sigma-70 family)
LLNRYFQKVKQLARKKLQGRPHLLGDEEDVALAALNSVILGAERGRFPRLLDRDDLWRLLFVVTVRKAIDLLRRSKPEEAAAEPDIEQVLSCDLSPELAVEMAEEYQRLFHLLGDDQLQAIARWKVEGHTNDEIANTLGCVPRTVERKLERIRILWLPELAR